MAKGNMLLGYARGKLGDLVFSRQNGQQTSRARNRNPKNPRTEGQIAQRSLFASAVGFYKEASQAFFKFAYEDKRPRETDFNAFMRYNTKKGVPGPPNWRSLNVPYVGQWIMSSGRLSPLVPAVGYGSDFDTANPETYDVLTTNSLVGLPLNRLSAMDDKGVQVEKVEGGNLNNGATAKYTLGNISKAIMQMNPDAQAGDIVTLYQIYVDAIIPSGVDVAVNEMLEGSWQRQHYDEVGQFILDPNDQHEFMNGSNGVQDVNGGLDKFKNLFVYRSVLEVQDGTASSVDKKVPASYADFLCAGPANFEGSRADVRGCKLAWSMMAVVLSRVTASGTIVSSAQMVALPNYLGYFMSDDFYSYYAPDVQHTWLPNSEAILSGALAKPKKIASPEWQAGND